MREYVRIPAHRMRKLHTFAFLTGDLGAGGPGFKSRRPDWIYDCRTHNDSRRLTTWVARLLSPHLLAVSLSNGILFVGLPPPMPPQTSSGRRSVCANFLRGAP
jgi:hypothetical protein